MLATLVSVSQGVVPFSADAAPPNDLTVNVVDVDTEVPITSFKYIVNVDNTGTTEQRNPADGCSPASAGYPASCNWTTAGIESSAPIYRQGTDADFPLLDVPDGRYLISILADGYKLDGAHFTMPINGPLTVELQSTAAGLPDATIQAAIFEDISPTNSAPDLPAEHGLAGFKAGLLDYLGDIQTDVYGNPLCTIYDAGNTDTPVVGTGGNCFSYCYVVDNGRDIGITLPVGGSFASNVGRCPTISADLAPGDPTGLSMWSLPADGTYSHPTSSSGYDAAVPATATIEGKLVIPHLGTNRYALSATAPNGQTWKQTTTLEGNHDWDAWVMEGATGLDTEFVAAGEPFPAIIFGYVEPTPTPSYGVDGTSLGSVTGVVDAVKVYVPAVGGLPNAGEIWGGVTGSKIDKPINKPWLSLSNLGNGDTAVWIGQGDANGNFTIPHVPDGTYTLAWWDEPQDYIMDLQNITVVNGEVVDTGVLPLQQWWTQYDGYVFNDTNRNGIMDWTDTDGDKCPDAGEGELGVPNYTLTMRKRENSLMDRGTTTVGTDACGHYYFESAYPMTQWLVMEAYNDLYYTTGVTYQADNQPTPTTVLGQGVDVSTLPIIGLSGRMDWGVHAYDAAGITNGDPLNGGDPRNGGIVGTVSYDTTRNEVDPRFAAVEDWQPGVSGLPVDLYLPVDCPIDEGTGLPTAACDPTQRYQLDADGSYTRGQLVNTYVTETWSQPGADGNANGDGECIPRDVDGNELLYPADQQITAAHSDCLEAPLMGVQFQKGFSSVDGNYGFGDGCFAPNHLDATDPSAPVCLDPADVPTNFEPLPGGVDYLVHVEIPNDEAGVAPAYKFTREEDINIANGDPWVPQVPPPACAGALHTVDVADPTTTDGYGAAYFKLDPDTGELVLQDAVLEGPLPNADTKVTVPASTPTENATFPDIGGSPYEGQQTPMCDTKLVGLNNGRSIVPTFNVFTDVPLPGRFWGLVVDDLNFSTNKQQINYGEKAGVPFAPVGIYDYTNRLVYTTESDYGGLFDVLMPSTNRISCPTPSGVCANLYRFVGNDPGVPGALNPNWNPQYRTIAAEFEAFPGLIVPADLAPTQVGVTVQLPGGQSISPVTCPQDATTPQLFAVSKPYVFAAGTAASRLVTINGLGFGAVRGTGQVTLDGVATGVAIISWSNTAIVVRISAAPGPHQLSIRANNGASTVGGLTFHVLGTGYSPNLYEVGTTANTNYTALKATNGVWFTPANTLPDTADHAIQQAIDAATASAGDDLVVVYPGLATPANSRLNPVGAYYENLILNSPVKLQGVGPGGFQGSNWVPGSIIDGSAFGGDSAVASDWQTAITGLTWDGNQTVNDGAIVSIYAQESGDRAFGSTYKAAIDGFDLRGGDQQGFPTNINIIGGGATGLPATVVTQGGAVFANAFARNLQITNNTVQNNGGGYGTIRIGTPDVGNNNNTDVRIANNRIIANGGTNLAGAIGLFSGSDNYEVAANDICGNFSAEYGGGISAFGLSPNGNIHHNRIYFNRSYDEGGGIMIAGELPGDPASLSPGSGAVSIHDNLIQANLSNDDGGGVRFLMAGNEPMDVYNNIIVNNVSTHEGGGVALDDATNVRFYNNTVMKNLTTATAITSDGSPAPAGLSTGANSAQLQDTLVPDAPTFSDPLLFNNIFWDNRAGTKDVATVIGLGLPGDATPVNNWDIGAADGSGLLSPTNSVLSNTLGTNIDLSNSSSNPAVVASYDTVVAFDAWRTNTAFIGAILVSADLSPSQFGNYHIGAASPAKNLGADSKSGVNAPTTDYDNQVRPGGCLFDAGADELAGTCTPVNLGITKTDGQTVVASGSTVTYTIVVSKAATGVITNAAVNDTPPANLAGVSWTCTAVGTGSSCAAPSGTGGINTTVTLGSALASRATFLLTGTVSGSGSVVNTATVTAPAGTNFDIDPLNNSASDTDAIAALPALNALDNFNRTNANTLGSSWTQFVTGAGNAAIRVDTNQARCTNTAAAPCNIPGTALWSSSFGSTQGAGFTFPPLITPTANTSLVLKATGGSATVPANFIRVQYQTTAGGRIVVGTTTTSGAGFYNQAVISGAFGPGDTLTAYADGVNVYVFRNGVWLGTRAIPIAGANAFWPAMASGGGRIGVQLPNAARIDNFQGA